MTRKASIPVEMAPTASTVFRRLDSSDIEERRRLVMCW